MAVWQPPSRSDDDEPDYFFWPRYAGIEVIDTGLMQPVGYVWFQKPRYRVAARSRLLPSDRSQRPPVAE